MNTLDDAERKVPDHTTGDGRLALLLGLGRFGGGVEAARFVARRGWRLRVADRAAEASLADSVAALDGLDVDWRLGGDDLAVLEGVDLLVVNPAVPEHNPVLAAARQRGIPTTQEVALFLESYPGRVVGVTGTNGKSTTTTLLARALERSGVATLCGGNLGHSLLADEPRWQREQVAVLELSSFQTERLDPARHALRGAVFTAVTRDHLDRHGSLAAYHRAKAVAAACARDFVVHAALDPIAASFATDARHRLVHRRGPRQDGAAAWIDDGMICVDPGVGDDAGALCGVDALALLGAFHVDNAMAAAIAALRLGARLHTAGLAIATQRPLPFRLQLAAVVDGVRYYDNAVSTALESTQSAIDSLSGPLHWVGGGKSKDGPEAYDRFAAAIAGRVASAHVFGSAAEPVAAGLRARGEVATAHDGLAEALRSARSRARPGEAILFSPGFASFDQFTNFRARATAFRAWLDGAARGRFSPVTTG